MLAVEGSGVLVCCSIQSELLDDTTLSHDDKTLSYDDKTLSYAVAFDV